MEQAPVTKTCTKCGETKSVDLFRFTNLNKLASGELKRYYLSTCKRCHADAAAALRRLTDPEIDARISEKKNRTIKHCPSCKKDLPATTDYFDQQQGKSRIPGNPPYLYFRYICKECRKINDAPRTKKWRAKVIERDGGLDYFRKSHKEYVRRVDFYKKDVAKISDSYVRGIIVRDFNIPVKEVPQDLILLKREAILLHREYKQLKQQLQ